MAERPDDQNAFSIRGLDQPFRRLKEVARLHPPGMETLGFTQIDPHAGFWTRLGEGMMLQQEMEDPIGTILARNGPQMSRVNRALRMALPQARTLIEQDSGQAAMDLLKGLLPLFQSLTLWAGGGAVLGGVAAGVLAGPEAAPFGAEAGLDLGLWIGGVWGLKDLLKGMAQNLGRFTDFASDGVEVAWYAGAQRGYPEAADLTTASEFFAYAIAELWMAFLAALVAVVFNKLAKGVTDKLQLKANVGEVAKRLSDSRLPKGFGDWFDGNFDQIHQAVEKWKLSRRKGTGDSGTQEETTTTNNPSVKSGSKASTPQGATPTKGKYPDFNPQKSNTNCGACSDSVDNYMAGQKFQPAPDGPSDWPKNPKSWDFSATPTSIEQNLLASGNGSRGIAYVADTAGNAHVFNVSNNAGSIVAVDGQTGMQGTITEVASHAGYTGPNLTWGWGPTFP